MKVTSDSFCSFKKHFKSATLHCRRDSTGIKTSHLCSNSNHHIRSLGNGSLEAFLGPCRVKC
eukprot:1604256-Amphidinium_carterae.1